LLATDQQRSVLHALDATRPHLLAYTPYGHRVPENGLLSLTGFNGERPDPVTGAYLLGNGYRAFSPVLMRFNSPDSLSPFGTGGLNSYAYCVGDPINRSDPTGHTWGWLTVVLRRTGLMSPSAPVAQPAASRNPSATIETIPSQTFSDKTPAWTTRDIIGGNAPLPYSGYVEMAMTDPRPVHAEHPNRHLHRLMFSLFIEDIRSFFGRARHSAPVVIENNARPIDFERRHDVPPPSYEESPPPSYSDAMDRIRHNRRNQDPV
jgi:RHS repeat-associated protein